MFEFILSPGGEVKNHQFGIFWHDAKFSSQIARESRYGEPKDGAEHGEIARLLSMLPRFDSGLATVICGLRFLLVLALLRRFFSSVLQFSSLHKNHHLSNSKIRKDRGCTCKPVSKEKNHVQL